MNEEKTDLNSNFLEALSSNIPGVIIYQYTMFVSGIGKFTYLSKNIEEYSGCSLNELYNDQEILRGLIAPDDIERFRKAEYESYQNLSIFDIEVRGKNGNGESQYLHFNSIPKKQENGDIIWNGILTDITEKVEINHKLTRGISELKLINQVSELIYNIHDELNLTQEVCKYLVEFGNYKLVWIGVKPEFDAKDQNLKIAAEYGKTGYTKDIKINLADKIQGNGPTANVLNTGLTTIANNFKLIENFAFWQDKADEYGLKGCVSIALNYHKHVTGNINIYSDSVDSFDEQEVKVLETIAKNLSTAVKNIRIKIKKEQNSKLLSMRIKELDVLHQVNKLLLNDNHDKDTLLNSIVNLIPYAFQFDVDCEARIKCGSDLYQSIGFNASLNKIRSEINCKEYADSFIEVVYPPQNESSQNYLFLEEEIFLLNTIAEMLETYFKKEDAYKLLTKSEANMNSIFENTEIGYFLMDVNFIIQSYNKIMLKEYNILTGFQIQTGLSFLELLHPDKKVNFNWVFEKITNEKKSFAYETTYLNETKLDYFEITAIPVLNKNEIIGYCIAAQNISKRKEMENTLLNTNSVLLRRNKDLEQFAFIVSHNLRAPVANIVALNSLLKESNDPIEKEEILEKIDISTERLETVIVDLNEILKVKKDVSELNEFVEFKDLLGDVKNILSKQIENSKIQISDDFSKCGNIGSIRTYLNSVFYNLISNSIKYAKAGQVARLDIWSEIQNKQVILHFKDYGIGINMEKYGSQLFGLYKRFNNNSEGNGIGLYMVKAQLESMGGEITAVSKPNEGTEFIITLPLVQYEINA